MRSAGGRVKGEIPEDLSTTSFAILGLLALRRWSGYELAQQVERSLRHIWPRTKRQLFEQPKRLVNAGLASATVDAVGRRPRTLYAITPKGRAALVDWLALPGRGPSLEWEGLIKVFFAEHLSKDQLLAHLRGIREGAAAAQIADVDTMADRIVNGFPFPGRLQIALLVAKFFLDYTDTVEQWAQWALAEVERWEDPAHPDDIDRMIREIYRDW
jgi:PadR family transcriptional regulator AphA